MNIWALDNKHIFFLTKLAIQDKLPLPKCFSASWTPK